MQPTIAPSTPLALTDRPHALYRFFDESGTLLYVGITHHPTGRWRQHRGSKPWWHEVRTITLEPFADRRSVLAAERAAIAAERPSWNFETCPHAVIWQHGSCWDSEEVGTLALYNEFTDELVLNLHHPVVSTIEALLDLRSILRDFINYDGGRPLRISVPRRCERGERTALLFAGTNVEEDSTTYSFTTKFRYKPGPRFRKTIDNHIRAIAASSGLTLWDEDA
jgi:hypothetical protein